MRLDELSFEMPLERRTTKGSSYGRIMPSASCARLHTRDALPDELQNVCLSSPRRIMRPQYKNGQRQRSVLCLHEKIALSILCPQNSCLRIVEPLFVISI